MRTLSDQKRAPAIRMVRISAAGGSRRQPRCFMERPCERFKGCGARSASAPPDLVPPVLDVLVVGPDAGWRRQVVRTTVQPESMSRFPSSPVRVGGALGGRWRRSVRQWLGSGTGTACVPAGGWTQLGRRRGAWSMSPSNTAKTGGLSGESHRPEHLRLDRTAAMSDRQSPPSVTGVATLRMGIACAEPCLRRSPC